MEFAEEVGESSSPPRSYGSFGGNNDVIRNDVYNRLIENGNEEAISNPHFFHLLEAHFNRLPTRFLLNVVCIILSDFLKLSSSLYAFNHNLSSNNSFTVLAV